MGVALQPDPLQGGAMVVAAEVPAARQTAEEVEVLDPVKLG